MSAPGRVLCSFCCAPALNTTTSTVCARYSSGTASVIARARQILVSLEHDEHWAGRVREHLAAAGLAETAEFLLAPLDPGAGPRSGPGVRH